MFDRIVSVLGFAASLTGSALALARVVGAL